MIDRGLPSPADKDIVSWLCSPWLLDFILSRHSNTILDIPVSPDTEILISREVSLISFLYKQVYSEFIYYVRAQVIFMMLVHL